MSTKHTPGPWSYVDNPYGNDAIYGEGGRLIAHVFGDDAQAQEDARLIAAAPDLLELLAAIVDNRSDCFIPNDKQGLFSWDKKARTAIAKATGEQP